MGVRWNLWLVRGLIRHIVVPVEANGEARVSRETGVVKSSKYVRLYCKMQRETNIVI